MRFSAEASLDRITAEVLYVLSRTDAIYPPSMAPAVMDSLRSAGIAADYVEIKSKHGHLASGMDAQQWGPQLRQFLTRISATDASQQAVITR
jgi:homoserine O-acetyltransferase/O-succinyltransferase